MADIIKVEHLSYVYNPGLPTAVTALDDVSFTVEEGDFVGIIGATGSGKSTLITHMNGLNKPTSGKIYIDGRDLWADPEKIRDFRFLTGLVFQYPEYQLFEETVYKDIAFGPINQGKTGEELDRCVREAARLVGIRDDQLDKSPFELSGGQKRRVALAGVMAMDPQVLVLDEPTSGLDPGERVRFRNLLSEFAHDRIVLISTHIVPDVEYIAMKNAVMKDGKIIETGTTPELVKRMEGKVFSEKIPARALADYEKKLCIVNLKNEPDGDITIRYLGDRPETEDSVSEEPRLEDLYLWLFPQNTDGRKTEERGTKGGKRR